MIVTQSDPATLDSVHPLTDKWKWSYKPTIVYKQQTEEDWLSDYQPVVDVPIDTVETFWRIYYNLPTLSALDCGNIYAVFRNNISASWEDKANEHGFSVVLYMNKHIPDDYMKMLYQNSLFVAIGSNASFSPDLNGCTFERKIGGNKIAFWIGKEQTGKQQIETASAILKALQIQFNDVSIVDEELRIDWRDPKYATQKITVKCMSHKKRATEPMLPRNRPSSRVESPQRKQHRSQRNNNTTRNTKPGSNEKFQRGPK